MTNRDPLWLKKLPKDKRLIWGATRDILVEVYGFSRRGATNRIRVVRQRLAKSRVEHWIFHDGPTGLALHMSGHDFTKPFDEDKRDTNYPKINEILSRYGYKM